MRQEAVLGWRIFAHCAGNLSRMEITVGLMWLVHVCRIALGLFGGRCGGLYNDPPPRYLQINLWNVHVTLYDKRGLYSIN